MGVLLDLVAQGMQLIIILTVDLVTDLLARVRGRRGS